MSIKNNLRSIITISMIFLLTACGGADERRAKYMERGKTYFEEGNLDKARIEFKNVLQIDPAFAEAYFYMGRLEEKESNLKKAIGNYRKAIDLNPQTVPAKIKLAKIYVVIGTDELIEEAKKLLAGALKADAKNPEALLVNATLKYKTGNKKEALAEIERVVRENYSLAEGVSLLATAYVDQKQYEKAVEVLEKGVQVNPDSVALKMSLARAYAIQKMTDKAARQLQQVIEQNPEDFKYRVALFSLYATTRQLEKAEQVLRQAIADKPDDTQRYLVLVEYISRQKSIGEAEQELSKAIKSNPSLMELRFAMARFYKQVNYIDKAKDVLREVVNIDEFDKYGVDAKVELASIAFQEKQYDAVDRYLGGVLGEHRNNNEALQIRAKMHLLRRDAEAAINDLRTVLDNEPKNSQAAMLLASAHDMAGQADLAEGVLKKSIETNPVDPKTHYNYARYLINHKRVEEANGIVDRALPYFKGSYELAELKLALSIQLGDEEAIVTMIDNIKQAFPGNAETYVRAGKYYASRKNFGRARQELEEALNLSTNKYMVLEYIVKTYLSEGKADQALQRINARLEKNKDDAISHQLLGYIYLNKKKPDNAREQFSKAIQLDKNWLLPYLNLATSYLAEGNRTKAEEVYRQAIANAGSPVPAYLQLASLYEKYEEFDQAIVQYREILKLDPGNLLAINNLAALIVENNPSAEDLRQAMDLTRNFEHSPQPAFLDTRGWIYVKLEKYAEAVVILRKAVEKAPNVAIFKYHLGVALKGEGKNEEARKYLEEAVNSPQNFMGKEHAGKLLGP